MIPLSDYQKIHNRPDRPTDGFEEGLELTDEDEAILDRVWLRSANERGVVQIPNQPTEEFIRNFSPDRDAHSTEFS